MTEALKSVGSTIGSFYPVIIFSLTRKEGISDFHFRAGVFCSERLGNLPKIRVFLQQALEGTPDRNGTKIHASHRTSTGEQKAFRGMEGTNGKLEEINVNGNTEIG